MGLFGARSASATRVGGAGSPAMDEIRYLLGERIARALSIHQADLSLSLLSRSLVSDHGTTVVLIGDAVSPTRAVMLLSAHASPLGVEQAMLRAAAAKEVLGAGLAGPILDPISVDRLNGLSYALLSYCRPLSHSRAVGWSQKMLLGSAPYDWLLRVNDRTLSEVPSGKLTSSYLQPLQCMAGMARVREPLRAAATRAIARLEAGDWVPKSVLMHGDLWKGNILLKPSETQLSLKRSSESFAVIDWGGSLLCGYPIYDIVRLAQSFRLSARALRSEIIRHCTVLRCESIDAQSYLVAALGDLAKMLDRFPLDRYLVLADACFTGLERVTRRGE